MTVKYSINQIWFQRLDTFFYTRVLSVSIIEYKSSDSLGLVVTQIVTRRINLSTHTHVHGCACARVYS